MPAPSNHDELDIYFQCRIPGCEARCKVSPKQSGRLGDHWKKEHIAQHGAFNGRHVLVKTKNLDGTFSTTTFDAYATAHGIRYKTQDRPRPTRHATSTSRNTLSLSAPAKTTTMTSRAPIHIAPSLLADSSTTTISATAQPTSNLRRVTRMERQLRIASLSCSLHSEETDDPDTLDSHADPPLSASNCLPLKRNLSQAFRESKPLAEASTTKAHASGSFNFPSAPAPKIPFSQMLIAHLVPPKSAPVPTLRIALNATDALRGTVALPSRIVASKKKDYSRRVWSCEMCHIDFPNMGAVTVHLRDHHAVESDVVTLTPDRDVITMVLASARVDDEEHGWVDGDGEAVREMKKSKRDARNGDGP